MTFTEIVFEVTDPRHPLCRLTRAAEGSHGIYRVLDTGQASRRHRAQVEFRGPDDACAEFVRDVRAQRPDETTELVHRAESHAVVQVESTADAGARGFAGILGILHSFGVDTLVEPFVVVDGRARVRFVVPRHLETTDALRAVQEIQRACGFPDFRIVRVGGVDGSCHLELMRRLLPPEQEALLGLASSLGYYTTPKGATLEQIAGTVGLSISPVHKRLKAAEERLVALHVQAADSIAKKRRSRRSVPRLESTQPCDVTLRVRASRIAGAFEPFPATRVILQRLSEEPTTRSATILLVALGPAEETQRLVETLAQRPDVLSAQAVSREVDQSCARLVVRRDSAYGFSWWGEVWGSHAHLRPLLIEDGVVTMRLFLSRPHAHDEFHERLAESAKRCGWDAYEVVAVRPQGPSQGVPPRPEPLTSRQLEVLRIAHALGYYQTPRKCTLEQVASTLGVSANAIHKNLVMAESKLIAAYLTAGV